MQNKLFTSTIFVFVLNAACSNKEQSQERGAVVSPVKNALVRVRPVVKSARANVEAQTITINVTMLNGCGDHNISLDRISICEESFPGWCGIKAWDTTSEQCESTGILERLKVISLEKTFTFAEIGIDRPNFFSYSDLSISGSEGSAVIVQFPENLRKKPRR